MQMVFLNHIALIVGLYLVSNGHFLDLVLPA